MEKITNPGLKDVYRIKDEHGRAVADMLAIKGEKVDMSVAGGYKFVDPEQPWKSTHVFDNCTAELLQILLDTFRVVIAIDPQIERGITTFAHSTMPCGGEITELWLC